MGEETRDKKDGAITILVALILCCTTMIRTLKTCVCVCVCVGGGGGGGGGDGELRWAKHHPR